MEKIIDLQNIKNKESLLQTLSNELFDYAVTNWDGFNDALWYLESGGIAGSAPRYEYPLTLVIKNSDRFAQNDPENFSVFKDILEAHVIEQAKKGLKFSVVF